MSAGNADSLNLDRRVVINFTTEYDLFCHHKVCKLFRVMYFLLQDRYPWLCFESWVINFIIPYLWCYRVVILPKTYLFSCYTGLFICEVFDETTIVYTPLVVAYFVGQFCHLILFYLLHHTSAPLFTSSCVTVYPVSLSLFQTRTLTLTHGMLKKFITQFSCIESHGGSRCHLPAAKCTTVF